MRVYNPITVPTLSRVEKDGIRRYQTPEGNLYPSVTTVFGVIQNTALDEWRARVGEEEARKIAKRAAMRGTYIHEQCEHLLKGTKAPANPINTMLYRDAWNAFKPIVNRIGNVYAIETQLYSDTLEVAGTVDCIGDWEGEVSVIDFKTSSRRKTHESIETYWMQTAAYAQMWEERTGIEVNNLVILMSVEDDSPLVFKDYKHIWLDKFSQVRVQYKNVKGE